MRNHIPFVIAFALFMETLDATILASAIPVIANDFSVDPVHLKGALTSYLLSLAIFIPISGWLADKYGSKKVFILAITVFTLGSLLCGGAFNLKMLIISRIIQGLGGALMMPVGRLILIRSFPKKDLVRVTNYMTVPSLIGPALGPILGGLIVSYISWRWIFIVNIPFGILGAWMAYKFLDDFYSDEIDSLDLLGFLLFSIGIAGFTYAFDSYGENYLSDFTIFCIILISFGLVFAYFTRAKKIEYSFIDFSIFKVRTFRVTLIGSFLSRCGIGGMPFLMPLFFQLGFAFTPLTSGLLLLPYALSMLCMKFFVAPIIRFFGFRNLLRLNTSLLGFSIIIFSFLKPEFPIHIIALAVFFHGLLTSLQFSCMNVLSYVDLNKKMLSKGTSLASSIQQLSMSFGIAISALILRSLLDENFSSLEMSRYAFSKVFLIIGILTFAASFSFFFLKDSDGKQAINAT